MRFLGSLRNRDELGGTDAQGRVPSINILVCQITERGRLLARPSYLVAANAAQRVERIGNMRPDLPERGVCVCVSAV